MIETNLDRKRAYWLVKVPAPILQSYNKPGPAQVGAISKSQK